MKALHINDDFFEISEMGEVYRDGIQIVPHKNWDGYLCICGKHNKTYRVHRLVALCYLENDDPENKTDVNHKDFDRANNAVSNLEWMSHADNVRYSVEAGRHARRYGSENPNYQNDTLHKKYLRDPDYAKEKQSRPKERNGRAKKVEVYSTDGEKIADLQYIGAFAEWLLKNEGVATSEDAVRSGIQKSIKTGVPYYGKFLFKKITN